MKRLLAFAGLFWLLVSPVARAEGPDDLYVNIYNLIQQADTLNEGGQSRAALLKYLEAQEALKKLQSVHPTWNERVVNFRLRYLEGRIVPLAKLSVPPRTALTPMPESVAPALTAPRVAPASEAENLLLALQEEIRRLQSDKSLLEAKLREALSVQPAAVDPRELAKAEEKLKAAQKENDLLKVSLEQERAKLSGTPDPAAFDQAKLSLADATQKLAAQTAVVSSLRLENEALKKKTAELEVKAVAVATAENLGQQLQQARAQLATLQSSFDVLFLEKSALESRFKTLLAASSTPSVGGDDLVKDLAATRAALRTSETQVATLRQEQGKLETRLAGLSAGPAKVADDPRLKQTQQERDELQKKLLAVSRELYDLKNQPAAGRLEDLTGQLAILRARLEVFEARQVPYTPEELALFKKPETRLIAVAETSAAKGDKAARQAMKSLPPGTGPLVAEAQRAYAAGRYEEAEKNFRQVLRQDEKNILLLDNLALVQIQMKKFTEAEANLKKALGLDAQDAQTLYLLGMLKYRQDKFDDALDPLSRASALDPQNAEIQNMLGSVLIEKGQRQAAETAFRKAIQLSPQYPDPHHNLAIIYAMQKPPFWELARWHYRKALDAGHARNPDLEKWLADNKAATPAP